MAVALAMREQGADGNDLLDRLAADARLRARPRRRSPALLGEPLDFVGTARGPGRGLRRPGRRGRGAATPTPPTYRPEPIL